MQFESHAGLKKTVHFSQKKTIILVKSSNRKLVQLKHRASSQPISCIIGQKTFFLSHLPVLNEKLHVVA